MLKDGAGRFEDQRFVTGAGRYTADLAPAGSLHVAFLRASHAHARISRLDTAPALAMAGVVAVFTAADLARDGVKPYCVPLNVTGPDGRTWREEPRPLLADGTIRFVGEPVAMVVARSLREAQDAAEAIRLEVEALKPVIGIEAARADAANLGYDWARGDWDKLGDILAASHHVARMKRRISRVSAFPMEPRNAFAAPEAGGRTALHLSHQNPLNFRDVLVATFGIPAEEIRCVAPDLGGSFGMKAGPLREEALVFHAARKLGRAVRWQGERVECFQSDEAGRDWYVEAELGLDAKGRFTGLRASVSVDIGAYASGRSAVPLLNIGGIAGVYATPAIACTLRGYRTNTAPTAPYRGAGRPEATFLIEQVIDIAARETGIDPLRLRLINAVPKARMPYATPFIFTYDSGDFATSMRLAAERADYRGFAKRKRAAAKRGKLRGIGIANPIEVAGGPYMKPMADYANVTAHADGSVTVTSGVISAGQGLETAMIRLVSQRLDLPADKIRFVQGDTALIERGKGMGGSAAMPSGAAALSVGLDRLIAQGREIAAERFETAPADIVFAAGRFTIAGTDRSLSLGEVAKLAENRPDGAGVLIGRGDFAPEAATYPNGCHICEVEIDIETGETTIVAYSAVEDIGHVINPQLAEGQVHGGAAQGLGQVLGEAMRYDPASGQLLTATLMDYALPRAGDLPNYNCGFHAVPTRLNPLGVKGVGEAGTVGALAAGMNAVCDALASAGVTDFEMPATPDRVWRALQRARGG